jgi:hypothetical protein
VTSRDVARHTRDDDETDDGIERQLCDARNRALASSRSTSIV